MNVTCLRGTTSGRQMLKKPLTGFVLGLCLTGFGMLGEANATPITVQNYSFETLPAGGLPFTFGSAAWSIDTIPGWNNSGSTGQQIFNGYDGNPAASDGIYAAFADNSPIWQTVTTAVAGTTYTLQTDIMHRTDVGMGGIIQLEIDGTVVTTGVGTDAGAGTWNTWTATYTATAADAGKAITIVLSNNGTPGYQGNFDNVRLDATAVPEPATISFFGIGGLAMAGARFKKRRKSQAVT